MTITVDPAAAIQQAISQIGGQVSLGGPRDTRDISNVAALLSAGIRDAALNNPRLLQSASKAPVQVRLSNPSVAGQKDWWNDVFTTIAQVLPVVVQALNKDYKAPTDARHIQVPQSRIDDKGWFDFVAQTLMTTVPQVINLLNGKDFNPQAINPPTPPPGVDKDWFSDALGIVGQVLPVVLALL